MSLVENTVSLTRNAPPTEVEIPVAMLGISVPHLVRPLDEQYIAELVETDEAEWEPIEVRVWPTVWSKPTPDVQYHVVSGNHRTSAARIKGLQAIRGRIIEAGDDLSYLLAAIRTNARHGRNFTEGDRRILAAKLKDLGQSSSQIAKLFGVHKSTVNNWLSGRDTNASRKGAREQVREQAADTLANLGVDLGRDWLTVPLVAAEAKELARVRQAISNFLAETPTGQDKAVVAAWIRSLTLQERLAIADDMVETITWLLNVTKLLKGREGDD